MTERLDAPKPSKGDALLALGRATAGAIPFGGAAAIEILNWLITPPIEKRRNRWLESLGERIQELESIKGITTEDLRDNEAFIDTFVHASRLALATSKEEMLTALRNAILNTALSSSLEDAKRHMFLVMIERFTEWHIRFLKLYHDPAKWFQDNGKEASVACWQSASLGTPLTTAYPELRNKADFYELIWMDLQSLRLVTPESLRAGVEPAGAMQRHTTDLGDELLAFITEPDPERG